MSYKDCSDWSKCTLCGQCLIKCPVLDLDKDQAKAEVQALIKGDDAPEVLSKCTLCYDCNTYCPEDLRPHELILERILGSRKSKISALIPYMCNGLTTPSFFPDLYDGLKKDEKEVLEKWSRTPEKTKDLLWVGCVGRLSCKDLDSSKTLESLPKYGPPELCCGELHYRFGSWAAYEDVMKETMARFEELDIDRMVCYCGSCYNFLSVTLPKVMGKELPFKLISLYQWLVEKMEEGEISIQKPLNYTAAVHESCYVTELEDGFSESLRTLYEAAGVTCKDLAHSGKNNLSCGAASICRDQNITKSLLPAQNAKFGEVKASGTSNMALNCPGCYLTLYSTAWTKGVKLKYMADELLKAFGDDVNKPLGKNMPLIVKTFVKRAPLPLKKVDSDFGLE